MTMDDALPAALGGRRRGDAGGLARAAARLATAWESRLRRIRRIAELIQRGKDAGPAAEKPDKND